MTDASTAAGDGASAPAPSNATDPAAPAPAPDAAAEPAERPSGLRERLLRPTLPELWLFLALALPTLAALVAALPTVDLTYQLRAGAEVLAGRGIPSIDTWTFTAAGEPWLDQQWGAQAILAGIYATVGWNGLVILRAILVAAFAGLIMVAIRRRAPGFSARVTAIFAIGAFIVAAPALALRPQLLGMICFVATLALLAGRRHHPRSIWLIPLIAVLWANFHGSFILAPALVGLAWLEDIGERSGRASRTFILGVVTAAATLLTPFGLGAWTYAAGLASNASVRERISEWQPTTLGDVPGILFWASVVVVGLLVLRQTRLPGGVPWPSVVMLVAFAALGAVAARGIAWWPAVAVVTLAGLAASAREAARAEQAEQAGATAVPAQVPGAQQPPRPAKRRAAVGRAFNSHIALSLAAGCILALPMWRPVNTITGAPDGLLSYAPESVTAVLRLSVEPGDRVWNPQAWGAWFEFAFPEATYAFDSRIEVIPAEAWVEGDVVLAAGAGWAEILDSYGVTIVVAEGSTSTPLATALRGDPRWQLAWADSEGTVWRRAPGSSAAAPLSSAP